MYAWCSWYTWARSEAAATLWLHLSVLDKENKCLEKYIRKIYRNQHPMVKLNNMGKNIAERNEKKKLKWVNYTGWPREKLICEIINKHFLMWCSRICICNYHIHKCVHLYTNVYVILKSTTTESILDEELVNLTAKIHVICPNQLEDTPDCWLLESCSTYYWVPFLLGSRDFHVPSHECQWKHPL